MEEDRDQKHVCKFCKKSYPCGRSLGGHMRSHVIMNSDNNRTEKKLNKRRISSVNGGSSSNKCFMGFEAGGHTGYGLRENPKKTWRLADSSKGISQQGKVCKECGKGFQSWKALFGHMRCHSEKEKVSKSLEEMEEEDSWGSQSDEEEAATPRRRRSGRKTRYKTTKSCSSFPFVHASTSSVSGIEQEQEDVAMCLMMLSRDVGYWGGLSLVAESSDNISVVFESKSSSCLHKEITKTESMNLVCNGGETVRIRKSRDKKLEKKGYEYGISDSSILREVSVNRFLGVDEFEKPKLEYELGFDVSVSELGKDWERCRPNCTEAELGKNLIKESGFDEADLGSRKYNSSNRTNQDARKKNKYKCAACNKIFHSYQALGGHRASHKKFKGCSGSRIDSSENSIEMEISPDPIANSKLIIKTFGTENPVDRYLDCGAGTSYRSKKSKGHECPICFKVFASGQALGGHKRSHLIGGSEIRGKQTIVIQKQIPEICDMLDLNLPAPSEEEIDGHVEFKPWWIGSNNECEPLVGLISN